MPRGRGVGRSSVGERTTEARMSIEGENDGLLLDGDISNTLGEKLERYVETDSIMHIRFIWRVNYYWQDSFADDACVICPDCELLTNIAPFPEIHCIF